MFEVVPRDQSYLVSIVKVREHLSNWISADKVNSNLKTCLMPYYYIKK